MHEKQKCVSGNEFRVKLTFGTFGTNRTIGTIQGNVYMHGFELFQLFRLFQMFQKSTLPEFSLKNRKASVSNSKDAQ